MKIGLIGLPLTGKTTVFNLLTGRSEETAAFAGGKQESHLANIKVPDERVGRLAEIYRPRKSTYAEIGFLDLAGLEVGRGGIPGARLSEMRNLDALVHVLRLFSSEAVPRVAGSTSVLSDARALEQELILTDLLVVEKRLERVRADLGKGVKELAAELELMERLTELLGNEQALRTISFSEAEEAIISGYQLLSRLPVILLANVDEAPPAVELERLSALAEASGLGFLVLNAQSEWEIAQLPADDRADFLSDLGVTEPARDRFLRTCYSLLRLISFFTVGDEEVRAWTLERGLTALRAAGKVHSDMERGFIRAEVISCEEFFALGSMAEARKQGALRLEGKDYQVQDGEVITIRFSV